MYRSRPKTNNLLQCPICCHVFSTATTLQTHVEQCLLQSSTDSCPAASASPPPPTNCASCLDPLKGDHYKCSQCTELYLCRSCNAMGRAPDPSHASATHHTSKHHIITVAWSAVAGNRASCCSSLSPISTHHHPHHPHLHDHGTNTSNSTPSHREPPSTPGQTPSSHETTVACPICLGDLADNDEDVGTMDSCGHMFCFECIFKWSDVTNQCPLCKARFQQIFRRSKTLTTTEGSASTTTVPGPPPLESKTQPSR